MNTRYIIYATLIFSPLSLACQSGSKPKLASIHPASQAPTAFVTSIKGKVSVRRKGNVKSIFIQRGEILFPGDTVVVGSGASALIYQMNDRTHLLSHQKYIVPFVFPTNRPGVLKPDDFRILLRQAGRLK